MAQVSKVETMVIFFIIVLLSLAHPTLAQDSEMAPSPAPATAMDAGAAFSLHVSAAAIVFSVIFSLLAMLWA
ncbi:hypothetical protein RJ641_026432 [Dillenia turbinata]|uniref:Transmembrane protein n=1 Tax=Dillenia turbinata TaxID=194707 RepID=A0AAN8ZU43_9MAGN